ncbi:FaeA/PapI family transcriptional regulator [Micropruina sp.]|uniref:FaeA/PapI family transcriptional regulator n=1 Tax=Micropruina sp. TaxID=2737536 RepID=UPI0039E41B09
MQVSTGTLRAIARKVGLSAGYVATGLRQLESAGLVERVAPGRQGCPTVWKLHTL